MQREQAEFVGNRLARVLEKLLPIMDDMDRAFKPLPPEQADSEWVTGFRLIQRKLQSSAGERRGRRPSRPRARSSIPALHYAVSHEEHAGLREGEIIAEVARGYKLGDRVLRPSMVRVAKGSARQAIGQLSI